MEQKNLKNLKLKIDYDISADVLYVSFGDVRSGIAIEVDNGDFVRIDPYTDEIVGITLLDFKERYMPSPSINLDESAKNIIPKILEQFKH